MSVQQDIQRCIDIMQRDQKGKNNLNFTGSMEYFDKPYFFSNELLYNFMNKMHFKNKRVLVTGSSGDQILFSQLFGASRITCFDINPFTKYIYALKVAYIKKLEYKQFYAIVTNKVNGFNELFNPANYKLVAPLLDEDTRYFWDTLMERGLNEQTTIFNHSGKNDIFKCKYITSGLIYDDLKYNLKSNHPIIKFITCDMRDLPSHLDKTKKYDVVLLSNIFDYCNLWQVDNGQTGYDSFRQIVFTLGDNYLKNSGIIQVGYQYGYASYATIQSFKELFIANKVTKINTADEHDDCGAIIYAPNKTLQAEFGSE